MLNVYLCSSQYQTLEVIGSSEKNVRNYLRKNVDKREDEKFDIKLLYRNWVPYEVSAGLCQN
jgi:hypothetical protein